MDKLKLMKTANEIRKGIVSSVHSAKAGHPGGSLSAADIFTYLYFEELNIDPKEPKKADRDRFVLSKGHTAPGLYSALAERGYFPKEDLLTLRHVGSYLQGHPDISTFRAWICLPVLWDRESQRQLEWRSQEKWMRQTTECIHFLEMVRSRKDRCGKHPCWQPATSWTIWL